MPIKENSFRIGCGRYLQKPHLLNECGKEILRFGNSPLIIGGKAALTITKETIENSLKPLCQKYEFIEHLGTCNEERANELSMYAISNGFNVIVGVGGGVIMDFVKLVGFYGDLPIINIPTSSATCASYTPLSVRYTPEGRTVGSKHFEYEIDSVLVDTAVISRQPVRLLLAGIFDALAKFTEIKQRFNDNTKEYPLGLDWAYILSKKSFDELVNKTEKCISDCKNEDITDTVEQVIFTSIAVTGVISGIARGSNQCALAHKFYEISRKMFFEESRAYLHGEIVGVGLLLQNHFNGEERNNDFLMSLMKKYNMPCCLSDIGINADPKSLAIYYDQLKSSDAINPNDLNETERLLNGLKYLWSLE
ncbi:MAG: iron-containing alcohol dehydrogenase [Clostridia bacterium]|nr:iron-containing alcohol dehydrogenase [Clostridia bacterium]